MSEDLAVALIDFNAAKKFDANKTQDTILMGTADYAAPEQFGFAQSDARTDIYALGTLLNIMLTGQNPKAKLYDGRLSAVISKCTNIDPKKRYSSVTKLQMALNSPSSGYMPPGFRTRKIRKMIIAVFGYASAFYFSFTLEIEGGCSVSSLVIYRLST